VGILFRPPAANPGRKACIVSRTKRHFLVEPEPLVGETRG
jgi:hypothetical protein